jgi:hypothetical protein
MPFLSGKQAFLQILKQEGVECMFGNPGTTELPLMDGLAREPGIRYVLALQESVAIAMADGYAHASGKLAAVNVHTSPGLGNAMGMLYDARMSGAPMLLTAGQHDQAMNLTEPILWSDLPPVARPYVKWSHEITRLEDLPRAVRRAVKTAHALSHRARVHLAPGGRAERGARARSARKHARGATHPRRRRRHRRRRRSCSSAPSAPSSWRATRCRRATRSGRWPRWRSSWARRSTGSACPPPAHSPSRIRSTRGRSRAWARPSATC